MNAPARSALGAALVVTLTVDDLRAIIRQEIEAARDEGRATAAPARLLVGPTEMARMLDISRTTLHRLRLEGCPAVRLGDVFKFEPPAVLAWLKERGQP